MDETKHEPVDRSPKRSSGCDNCGCQYGRDGFHDLVIPSWAWRRISPTGDDGGVLCPTCIIGALEEHGIECEGALLSGPLRTVSPELMTTMRWVENMREREERSSTRADLALDVEAVADRVCGGLYEALGVGQPTSASEWWALAKPVVLRILEAHAKGGEHAQ